MTDVKRTPIFRDFMRRLEYDWGMQVEVIPEETVVLIGWKKRSGDHALGSDEDRSSPVLRG